MRMTWERMKIVIEPSAAVPLACLLERSLDVSGRASRHHPVGRKRRPRPVAVAVLRLR
jgi:threonine dehydratase